MRQLERPPLVLQLVFLGKHLGHLLERRLANRGLNRTHTMVLTALRHHPGLKAQDLCGPARVEPANITRTLQSLERLGLLERRPHPTDGRASLFYLTAAGEAMAGELSKDVKRLSAELLGAMEPQELSHLEETLSHLLGNLRGMAEFEHPPHNNQTPAAGPGEGSAGDGRGRNAESR